MRANLNLSNFCHRSHFFKPYLGAVTSSIWLNICGWWRAPLISETNNSFEIEPSRWVYRSSMLCVRSTDVNTKSFDKFAQLDDLIFKMCHSIFTINRTGPHSERTQEMYAFELDTASFDLLASVLILFLPHSIPPESTSHVQYTYCTRLRVIFISTFSKFNFLIEMKTLIANIVRFNHTAVHKAISILLHQIVWKFFPRQKMQKEHFVQNEHIFILPYVKSKNKKWRIWRKNDVRWTRSTRIWTWNWTRTSKYCFDG